ncbi:MAG: peptidoglycan-binding protein [bacterium]|nr:peptidoglycan-binding protein [bacterium]MCP4964636.1 peptidoglycan-binding protein [bacterium]
MFKTGSSGDEVAKLKRRLAAVGFDPGGADGVFGLETNAALEAFQEKAGIAADGICSPQTLEMPARLRLMRCPDRPPPARTRSRVTMPRRSRST